MRYDPLNKNKKRMLAGLLLASLLGTGTVWASPLEQGVKPAETVLLDETDGPLSHIQKKKTEKKARVQKEREPEKKEQPEFLDRIRGIRKQQEATEPARKQEKVRKPDPPAENPPGRTGRNGRLGNRQKRKNSGPCPLYPVTWAWRIPTAW